jgi:transposase-like protein
MPAHTDGDGVTNADPITDAGVVARPHAHLSPPASASATRHGLTATKTLPTAMQLQVASHLDALRHELRPATHLEDLTIREMARHAAALEFAQPAEQAVLNVAGRASSSLAGVGGTTDDDLEADESALAGAVGSELTERLCRYRRSHERGFYAALAHFKALRNEEPKRDQADWLAHFADNRTCVEHLRRRIDAPTWRCPHCRGAHGHWLAARQRWECAACHKQVGLRAGTVMEHSPLPLTVWCGAIVSAALDLGISAYQLQEVLGISRPGTARSMLLKIRAALSAPDADYSLAGLNRLVLQDRRS